MPSVEMKPRGAQPGDTAREQSDTSAELRPSTDAPGGAVPRTSSGAVFISHRVKPDEPIAAALKELLETTIEPAPAVFVSGVGGIIPSWETAWGQMQSAAATAEAFVAVITTNSLEREWIFFEAGAAWGRRCLYAPLLVKVEPEELPNTLKGYHATPYDQEAKVRELVREIAGKVGGVLKTRAFQSKYKTFSSALADHLGDRRPSAEVGRAHTVDYAFELIVEDSDEAKRILDKFEPDDSNLKNEIALLRIHFEPGLNNAQRLERLEAAAPELRHAPLGQLGFAAWEAAPHVALKAAMAVLGAADGNAYRYKRALDLATAKLKLLGRPQEARELLDKAVRDPRRVVRAHAALKLAADASGHEAGRAALAAYAVASYAVADTLVSAAREMHGNGLNSLYAYVAEEADRRARSAESAHWLGLAFDAEGIASAAYRAFKRAADGGLKLAHVSLASLYKAGAVPAAGLDQLVGNPGPYEAASAKYPYSTRAEIEEAVQEDDKRATALVERGKAHFAAVVAALDQALTLGPVSLPAGEYLSTAGVTYEISDAGAVTLVETVPGKQDEKKQAFLCWRDCPLQGMAILAGAGLGFVYAGPSGTIVVTWLAVTDTPVVVEQLSPIESRRSLLASASPSVPVAALARGSAAPD